MFLLLVVAGTWAWQRSQPYDAPTGPDAAAPTRPDRAAAALRSLEKAVTDGDRAAAVALATPGDQAAEQALGDIVDNAAALRVRDFTLRYVDEDAGVAEDGDWVASVDAGWRFDGFDENPARSEVSFTFAADGEDASIRSVGGHERRSPLWLTERLAVRRTAQTLVLSAERGVTDRYAAYARAAVPVVRAVLPDWSGGLVVEVPASAGGLHEALDAPSGDYAGIAAVTTTVDGSLAAGSPVHVFVNPDVFGGLKPTGAQVVMSHEATHVATEAATSQVPLWLLEGFADYVALRDVDLPLSVTAGQIAKQVRQNGPPSDLPAAEEFDTTTSHLGAAYEAAWQACELLAERGTEASLVRFYDQVSDGADPVAAMREVFGFSQQSFIKQWRQRLQHLAA